MFIWNAEFQISYFYSFIVSLYNSFFGKKRFKLRNSLSSYQDYLWSEYKNVDSEILSSHSELALGLITLSILTISLHSASNRFNF